MQTIDIREMFERGAIGFTMYWCIDNQNEGIIYKIDNATVNYEYLHNNNIEHFKDIFIDSLLNNCTVDHYEVLALSVQPIKYDVYSYQFQYTDTNETKECTCNYYAMLREGCKCGAIKPYQGEL